MSEEVKSIKERVKRAKGALHNRQMQYREVFNMESPAVQKILHDLAKFCKAHETTFHVDARAHAVAEGRREVWLRIQNHIQMDLETIFKLYNGG